MACCVAIQTTSAQSRLHSTSILTKVRGLDRYCRERSKSRAERTVQPRRGKCRIEHDFQKSSAKMAEGRRKDSHLSPGEINHGGDSVLGHLKSGGRKPTKIEPLSVIAGRFRGGLANAYSNQWKKNSARDLDDAQIKLHGN